VQANPLFMHSMNCTKHNTGRNWRYAEQSMSILHV